MRDTMLILTATLVMTIAPTLRADDASEIKAPPVTMHLTNVRTEDVIAELRKRTGAAIVFTKDPNPQKRRRVSVNFENKTFWEAMNEIESRCKVQPVEAYENDGVHIDWAGDGAHLFGKRPASNGPYATFLVDRITRTSTVGLTDEDEQPTQACALSMMVFIDPRLHVMRVQNAVNIDSAEDESGNSVLAPDPQGQQPAMNPTNSTWQLDALSIPLEYDPAASHKIAILKGSLRATAAVEFETLEVKDFATAANTEQTIAGVHVVIDQIQENDDQKKIEVRMTLTRDGISDEDWQNVDHMVATKLWFETADGARQNGFERSTGGDENLIKYTLRLGWQNPGERPVKLRWEIPSKFEDVDLPFEFHDVKLP